MNLTQFYNTYNGQTVGDGECPALVKAYEREVLGFTEYYGLTYAYQWYTDYPNNSGLQNHYERYTVGNGLPIRGDIIVWSSAVGSGAGHVGIAYSNISAANFVSFDQNWSVHHVSQLENHTWNNVLGWLRPKGHTPPVPPTPTEYEGNNYKKWLYSSRTKYRLT